MKIEEIYKHLKLQDSNLKFYKNKCELLEQQVNDIKHISSVKNTVELKQLLQNSYTKEEIIIAYNKMLKYEGIEEDRVGGLIVDTFIDFLAMSHHSLNAEL